MPTLSGLSPWASGRARFAVSRLQRPQAPSMCRGPHAGALRLSLVLIRSAPSIRVCCHLLQPLSEEKAVRGFIINIVTEKNQKKEKVLTGKMGR
jgi:hypothetical protein